MPSATAEPCADSPKPRGRPFTKDNAAEMAARAHESRQQNIYSAIPPLPNQPDSQPAEDIFTSHRLATVRAQMSKLDRLIASEQDPQKLDRLASAAAKLAELERQYAGRPLPGSLRPNATPKRTMFDSQPTTARATPQALEQPATSETERAEQE